MKTLAASLHHREFPDFRRSQSLEIGEAHFDRVGVGAGVEHHVLARGQPLIHPEGKAVQVCKRRHPSDLAVGEEVGEFVLFGYHDLLCPYQLRQSFLIHFEGGGDCGKNKLVVSLNHDGFDHASPSLVLDSRDLLGGVNFGVGRMLVLDLLFVQQPEGLLRPGCF